MPTYSIKAPDGKTYRIDGPAGATQAQVQAQVLKQYPGAGQAAPVNVRDRQQRKFGNYNQTQAQTAIATAEKSFMTSMQKKGIRGQALDTALTRFRTDPRMNALRKSAGLPEQYTRRELVRETARRVVRERQESGSSPKWATALGAGVRRSLFGIPERLAAAGLYYTGQGGNDYNETLDFVRDKTDAELAQSTGGNIIGQVGGSLVGGGAVASGIRQVGARAAASGAPIVSRAGNYLQNLITLRKGQTVRNAGKIIGSGAGYGTAQAVGEGSDPVKGAAYGAAGGAAIGGALKLGQVVTRPLRDVLRLTNADRVLARLTSSTRDEISERAAAYREATGAEPTLFEMLPLADRNKILKQGIVGRDAIVERASGAIRQRADNLGPEMSRRTQEILEPRREAIEAGIADDLARARGGTLDPADPALAGAAARSPTDLLALRGEEARAIMAPHENVPVVSQLDELFPSAPATGADGTTGRIATDPEVSAVIRSAAGIARQRAQGDPITAGDVTDMISTLRGDLAKGGIEGRTAERAIAHLEDVLEQNAPAAGQAAREMSEAFAARSRMAEGMQEGARTRLRDDVQVGTSRREAQRVRNAYDSPEGAAGRALGQSNKILSDLGGSPDEALRATVAMSRGTTSRAMAQNLGPDESARIITAARAQDESAQALAAASQKAQASGGGGALDGEGLVQALVGLHPSSFITTKASAIRQLMDMTYIPESRARVMVDMLFSQNPALARRALNAIGNSPNGAAFTQRLAGTVGQAIAGDDREPSMDLPDLVPEADAVPVEEEIEASRPDFENLPYGQAIVESIFPGVVVTQAERDPESELGQANSSSYHVQSQNAVDVRPIPGMTFDEFISQIEDSGYEIIEAIDEVNNPSKHATGPHWHVVIAGEPDQ